MRSYDAERSNFSSVAPAEVRLREARHAAGRGRAARGRARARGRVVRPAVQGHTKLFAYEGLVRALCDEVLCACTRATPRRASRGRPTTRPTTTAAAAAAAAAAARATRPRPSRLTAAQLFEAPPYFALLADERRRADHLEEELSMYHRGANMQEAISLTRTVLFNQERSFMRMVFFKVWKNYAILVRAAKRRIRRHYQRKWWARWQEYRRRLRADRARAPPPARAAADGGGGGGGGVGGGSAAAAAAGRARRRRCGRTAGRRARGVRGRRRRARRRRGAPRLRRRRRRRERVGGAGAARRAEEELLNESPATREWMLSAVEKLASDAPSAADAESGGALRALMPCPRGPPQGRPGPRAAAAAESEEAATQTPQEWLGGGGDAARRPVVARQKGAGAKAAPRATT